MEYAKLKEDTCGFYKNDIGKIEEYNNNSCRVTVPGRVSTSCLKPSVLINKTDLIESTKEEYDKAHGIIDNEILPEDLIKGEYYYAINKNDKKRNWIRKHEKLIKNKLYCIGGIDLLYNIYSNDWIDSNNYTYAKANQFQINHLDACIKANKYVPESEVTNDSYDNLVNKPREEAKKCNNTHALLIKESHLEALYPIDKLIEKGINLDNIIYLNKKKRKKLITIKQLKL